MGKVKQSKKKEKSQKKAKIAAAEKKNKYIIALAEHVDILQVKEALKKIKDHLKTHDSYNDIINLAFYTCLLEGDIDTMQEVMDIYKNHYLESGTDGWSFWDKDGGLVAEKNEEAYRLTSEVVVEEIKFMEILIKIAKQAMSECV
jgi:hypothetical protein